MKGCVALLEACFEIFFYKKRENLKMETQGIFSGTIPLLEKTLDLRSMKHNLIVSNIANMDTPNYKTFDIIIKEELENAMGTGKNIKLKRTRAEHFSERETLSNNVKFRADDTQQFSMKTNGNSVDIDKEMGKLSENNLMYNALAQIISRKFEGLKNVIREGR